MSITDRIRPNVEAAPWVITEIKKREEVTTALIEELTRQKTANTKLRELLTQMLNVAENADETGYVTDVGFVDLDKLHETVRAALKS
jgi:hypothetical protein